MESLIKKLESHVISRLFAFLGIGMGISAGTACLLTKVPEYHELLYAIDAKGQMMLSVSAWILLLLPLMMFLALPKDVKTLSFGAISLIYGLFCCLIGAALCGVAVVYLKADIALSFAICAGMFVATSITGATCRKDMISWHCVLLTAVWGLLSTATVYWLYEHSLIDLAVNTMTVIVFCAVTAYSGKEIQSIISGSRLHKKNHTAIRCALAIYLNLVGLVIKTLRFWESKGDCK